VTSLVILALLVFTTIRTSPISAGLGPGSSLSSTTPKQRQFIASDLGSIPPALVQAEIAPLEQGQAVPAEFDVASQQVFFARCSDLPPPSA
jgi:hypothetical protein